MPREAILRGDELEEDQTTLSLRPQRLSDFIGQTQLKEQLRLYMEAARARGDVLDHILLHGPPGLGKCITPDSFILTAEGWVEFRELIPPDMPPNSYKPYGGYICGLRGLELASHIYASGRCKTIRVLTQSGFELEGTPNHRVIVATPQGPQWKQLDELTPEDYVAIRRGLNIWGPGQAIAFKPVYESNAIRHAKVEERVRLAYAHLWRRLGRAPRGAELRAACGTRYYAPVIPTAKHLGLPLSTRHHTITDWQLGLVSLWEACPGATVKNTPQYPTVLDADLAYLMGIIIGDGHFEQGANSPCCRITTSEAEVFQEVARISAEKFGRHLRWSHYQGRAPFIRLSQTPTRLLLQLGMKMGRAKDKEVPTAVLRSPAEVVAGFLQGLFDADGHVWADGYIEWTTKSLKLARQVQLLLANFGIIAHRHVKQVRGQSYQVLFIGGQDAERFFTQIGFRLRRKQERRAGLCGRPHGVTRSDRVPFAHVLLGQLFEKTKPHPRALHKTFEHVKQGDRLLSRATIRKYLSLLPPRIKQEPELQKLEALLDPTIYWDRVASLEPSEAEVYDFCVPGSHAFVANGFINHNTTLALIIAAEMGVNIKISSGPAIERPGDLAAIVTNLNHGDVLFIDEIHRLRRNVEELLYPAMEDFKLDLVIGEGPHAQSIRLDLPKFTLIGATTRTGLLTNPLRDRFEVVFHLDFYDESELKEIVLRGAQILGVKITDEGAHEIARRARGTPRVANRLLKRVRDFAQVKRKPVVDREIAREALAMLQIDEEGLDELDRKILRTIIEKFDGGPVGLETLSAALSEEKDTLSEVYEPYLLKKGFIQRTPQGRVATERAYKHLGITLNKAHETPLL